MTQFKPKDFLRKLSTAKIRILMNLNVVRRTRNLAYSELLRRQHGRTK